MNYQVDIDWPVGMPLPMLDTSGVVRNSTLVGKPSNGAIARRSRFTRTYPALAVSWCLTLAQYQVFKVFFDQVLGNGISQFKISLRFPKTSGLTDWAVRFNEGYQASYDDGKWNVQAILDAVTPITIS